MWILKPTFIVPARRVQHRGHGPRRLGDVGPGRRCQSPRGRSGQGGRRAGGDRGAELVERSPTTTRKAWPRRRGVGDRSREARLGAGQDASREVGQHPARRSPASRGVQGRLAARRRPMRPWSAQKIVCVCWGWAAKPSKPWRRRARSRRGRRSAPAIDGRVVQREITLGELVGPDRESLMILADTSTLWCWPRCPRARLHEIAVGVEAWVTAGIAGGRAGTRRIAFICRSSTRATHRASPHRGCDARLDVQARHVRRGRDRRRGAPDGAAPRPSSPCPTRRSRTVEGGPSIFVPVENEANTFRRRSISAGQGGGRAGARLRGARRGRARGGRGCVHSEGRAGQEHGGACALIVGI